MLGFEPLTRCCHCHKGNKKDIVPKHPACSQNRNTHRCQNLGIHRTGASHIKGMAKTHDIFWLEKQWIPVKHTFPSYDWPRVTKPTQTSVLDKGKNWITIVLDFSTNITTEKRKYGLFHFASEYSWHSMLYQWTRVVTTLEHNAIST